LPIIVVGGSNKSVGKTALICGILTALPDLRWTAVKITTHRYGQSQPTWEEPAASSASDAEGRTDTARFLAAGAQRAFLLSCDQAEISQRVGELLARFGPDASILFESNRIVECLKPDLCLGVVGAAEPAIKDSYSSILRCADALVATDSVPKLNLPARAIPMFRLAVLNDISPALLEWLRVRISPNQLG
jgi:molybdopterin-guanine dinucleotide biosynthesis protein